MDTIVYKIGDNLYVNLTNQCTNNCDFCVRNEKSTYEGYSLWLEKEPTVQEVKDALGDIKGINEVVFCGFGEPLMRADAVMEIAAYVHQKGVKTRINTNGQANFFYGKDLPKKLSGLIDTVNVSLNATDADKYDAICHSVYGKEAFDALLDFARECVKYIPNVILSVVDVIGAEEVEKAKALVATIKGAKIRVREFIE